MQFLALLLTFCVLPVGLMTYNAGLKLYGIAMSVVVFAGFAAVSQGLGAFGLILFFAVIALIANSQAIMKQYQVGPYRRGER